MKALKIITVIVLLAIAILAWRFIVAVKNLPEVENCEMEMLDK